MRLGNTSGVDQLTHGWIEINPEIECTAGGKHVREALLAERGKLAQTEEPGVGEGHFSNFCSVRSRPVICKVGKTAEIVQL